MTDHEDLTFDQVVELTRRNKREAVAKWKPGMDDDDVDLVSHAVVVRGGRSVALVYAGPSGALSGRRAGYLAAALMRADEIWFVADSIMAKKAASPEELDKIKPGEMVEAWRAGNREGLTEALTMQRFDRSGQHDVRSFPYVRIGALVTWGKPYIVETQAGQRSGAVADYIADGFKECERLFAQVEPIAAKVAAVMNLEGGDAEREWHIDRACAKRASEADGGAVVLLEPEVVMFIDGREVAGVMVP